MFTAWEHAERGGTQVDEAALQASGIGCTANLDDTGIAVVLTRGSGSLVGRHGKDRPGVGLTQFPRSRCGEQPAEPSRYSVRLRSWRRGPGAFTNDDEVPPTLAPALTIARMDDKPWLQLQPTNFYIDGKYVRQHAGGVLTLPNGTGVTWEDGRRLRVIDSWYSFDHHGRMDTGMHIFFEDVTDRDGDLPGELMPEYFRPNDLDDD
ncbi:MAG TPA: hypothetical protein VGW38_14250 [Chloroflexota bacterium]|nr:hypothetical protein [Chloroflexota bacterium]